MSVYNEPEEERTSPVPKEERVVEPLGPMVKRAALVEEATTKGLILPALPCRLKVTVEEVALMPATVPLSMIFPLPKALAEVQMALRPTVPEPERPLPAEVMVIAPGVEVVMVMLVPLIKVATPQPVPLLAISWPVWVGAEVVPVPPEEIPTTPERLMVEVPVMEMLVPAVKSVPMSE